MIRKVARMGHPILRKRARDLTKAELDTDYFRSLLRDMVETMHEYGGIGLAAPQIHESVRVCVIDLSTVTERYPEAQAHPDSQLGVYVNPVLDVLDPTPQGYWEGCLSVPDLRGWVERPRSIQVRYWNEHGEERIKKAEGFLATVFQHEFDHLDGTLYVDRIQDPRKLSFLDEYRRYWIQDQDSSLEE